MANERLADAHCRLSITFVTKILNNKPLKQGHKHSSLLGPYVTYKENEVLRIIKFLTHFKGILAISLLVTQIVQVSST